VILRRIGAFALCAFVILSVNIQPASAFTIFECEDIRRDLHTIIRNFYDQQLDGVPGSTNAELRPHLRSAYMREDDALFDFVVDYLTTQPISEEATRSETYRGRDELLVTAPIYQLCRDGTILAPNRNELVRSASRRGSARSAALPYTSEECGEMRADALTIIRNFHTHHLDRVPSPTNFELRPQLQSRHMREDDGVFSFVVEVMTGDLLEEFSRMSRRERERNQAFVASQIRQKCLDGTVRRYAFNR